jgi:hypothetical protein
VKKKKIKLGLRHLLARGNSLVGFVILEPWYFFQRTRKLAQNFLLEPEKVALVKKVALVF